MSQFIKLISISSIYIVPITLHELTFHTLASDQPNHSEKPAVGRSLCTQINTMTCNSSHINLLCRSPQLRHTVAQQQQQLSPQKTPLGRGLRPMDYELHPVASFLMCFPYQTHPCLLCQWVQRQHSANKRNKTAIKFGKELHRAHLECTNDIGIVRRFMFLEWKLPWMTFLFDVSRGYL